jgi:predicted acylesterase/phospholipase RssA
MDAKYVVFSSGALGGISLIGGWKALENLNVARNIKGMSGCSMGSIIATLASLNFSAEEMRTVSSHVKYEDYADQSFRSISETYGIESGNRLMKLLERLIKFKTGRKGLTFKEHWRITGRQLWINATHVEENQCVYYSVHTAPDMLITDAIRRSISIPFLFASVRTPEGTFVDGACYDPVPAHMFPKDKTICLNVRNRKEDAEQNVIGDLFEFSASLLGGMFSELNKLRFKTQEMEGYKMIYIRTGIGSLSFSLTEEQINYVISVGYDAVTKYYNLERPSN